MSKNERANIFRSLEVSPEERKRALEAVVLPPAPPPEILPLAERVFVEYQTRCAADVHKRQLTLHEVLHGIEPWPALEVFADAAIELKWLKEPPARKKKQHSRSIESVLSFRRETLHRALDALLRRVWLFVEGAVEPIAIAEEGWAIERSTAYGLTDAQRKGAVVIRLANDFGLSFTNRRHVRLATDGSLGYQLFSEAGEGKKLLKHGVLRNMDHPPATPDSHGWFMTFSKWSISYFWKPGS